VKRKPGDGSTHWSTRKLGEQLNISHMMVARVWHKHALRPHRLEGYMASNDPDFSAHKSQPIKDFLKAHSTVHLHFPADEPLPNQLLRPTRPFQSRKGSS
jgi:hypothetical protein